MVLENVNIVGAEACCSIKITDNKIERIYYNENELKLLKDELHIQFEEAIAFPGLINSHDHLEFNLFPSLGNRKYKNYLEWGEDIHQQNKDIIEDVLKIPSHIRYTWGLYKNLFCGVTTVVQHGPIIKTEFSPIDVFVDCHSLHSVKLEKYWRLKLNNPFAKRMPFVFHTGEGVDKTMHEEIDSLTHGNFFNRTLIGVHAISMDEVQSKFFNAVVWCPESNIFLYGETAPVDKFEGQTKVVFGSDSTVSSGWNMYEHLRVAKKTGLLSDSKIYQSITIEPASIWKLEDKGKLDANKLADVVIAKKSSKDSLASFFNVNPENILLVIKNGKIILADEGLMPQLAVKLPMLRFSKIFVNGVPKRIDGDVAKLMQQANHFYKDAKFPIQVEG